MAKSKADKLAEIHKEAVTEFDRVFSTVADEREQCLNDRRFYSISGAQWDGELGEQFENKPKFEVNKVHLSVIRIFNEYRNNRITVNFVSKDGSIDDELADTCDGLYRATEQESTANEAYDNAFEEAVGGGMGAWRLTTVYDDEEDEDDDRQRILIEPIFDADTSVFFDLGAKRQDKSDARKCWVISSMDRTEYEEVYGDDVSSWNRDILTSDFEWASPDLVYIVEYYVVEEDKHTVVVWEHIGGEEERLSVEESDEREAELLAMGSTEVRRKKVTKKKVRKYILSGNKVLEDCGYIAGQCIPIVPVYGKRWYVDNIERYMGHVRLAKDAQRLKNMQLSRLGEISALSPIEKPIFTPEQVAGFETEWAEDNIKNYPYLRVNPIEDINGNMTPAGALGYTKPAQIPPAMAALLQITEEDMQDILGNQQDGEQMMGNVAQGTVELIQNKLDMQTYIYMSNMAKAMRRCGQIWLSMAKDVYVEEGRQLKTLTHTGESDQIELVKPMIDEDGELVTANDLNRAKFDVHVEVGASSSTKRAATVRALTQMVNITTDEQTKQVLGAMAMMNMEGEGIADARQYFRKKLIGMGVIEPTESEAEEMAEEAANQQPSPNDQYLLAAAENEKQKAAKAQAEILETQADTDKTRAEMAEIAQNIDAKQQEQALEVMDRLGQRVTPPNLNFNRGE